MMKMYVWSDIVSFTAIAQAESIEKARALMLGKVGESGDGSCPERDRARRIILNNTPSIWYGPNAEFRLSDSVELREQELLTQLLQQELTRLKEQIKDCNGRCEMGRINEANRLDMHMLDMLNERILMRPAPTKRRKIKL